MKQYIKVLRIQYHDKIFDVFSNSEHQRMFLEVKITDNQENYYYPQLTDYIHLSAIYNREDDGILYLKKHNFKNIVSVSAMTGLIVIYGLTLHNISSFDDKNYQLEKENPTYQLVNQESEIIYNSYFKEGNTIYIHHNSALANFGFNEVTFDQVRETLESNEKLTEEQKKYVKDYIDALEERLPEVDLRIFNENLKTLEFEVIENENWPTKGIDAYYDPNSNKILVKDSYTDLAREKEVYFHELGHTLNNTVKKYIDPNTSKQYRIVASFHLSDNYGKSFSEGFNCILTQYLLTPDWKTYFDQELHYYNSYQEVSSLGYQVLMLDNSYNLYNYLNGNVIFFEDHLKKYDLEEMIEILDTELKTDDTVTIIDHSALDEIEEKLLQKRIEQQLSLGKSDLEVYQAISSFVLSYNQKYDISSEILNDSNDNWTLRIKNPTEKEKTFLVSTSEGEKEATYRTTSPEVTIYNLENIVCQTDISNIIIYSTNKDADEIYHFGVINYKNESLHDVLTEEEINVEDIKETVQLKQLLNQFYLYDIDINTTILNSKYFQSEIQKNSQANLEEITDSNHIIK